jgi:hypothetical protein
MSLSSSKSPPTFFLSFLAKVSAALMEKGFSRVRFLETFFLVEGF